MLVLQNKTNMQVGGPYLLKWVEVSISPVQVSRTDYETYTDRWGLLHHFFRWALLTIRHTQVGRACYITCACGWGQLYYLCRWAGPAARRSGC